MVQIVPRLGGMMIPQGTAGKASPTTARAAGAGAAVPQTDLGGLLSVLRAHILKIILASAAGLGLALWYLAVATPSYTAIASLFVDPRTRKIVSEEIVQGGFGSDLALVESQVSILTSDAVLKRVVDNTDLNLSEDPEFAPPRRTGLLSKLKSLLVPAPALTDKKAQALVTLNQNIKVKRAQKTYVVDVEVSASTPSKAQKIAQAVVDAYLADQTATKAAEASRANSLIDARLGELRDQVRRAETRVDDFKRANKILTSEGGIVTEQQLTRINGELITARAVAAESKARHDQILEAMKSGAGPEVLPDAVRSGLIQRLREQYAQVARREAALATQLQPKHPVLIDVRSQLAEVKTQIADELRRVAAAAKSEYQIAESRERELSNQLEASKSEVTRTNTAQIKLRELDQEVAASRELLRLFLARAKETQEQQNTSTPDARVITFPSMPAKPAKPVTWLVLALGLVGGLGLGLASALLSDHMDKSIRRAGELGPHLGDLAVSTVPLLPRGRGFSIGKLGHRRAGEPVDAAQFSDLLTALTTVKDESAVHYRQSILRILSKIKNAQKPGQPYTVMLASPVAGTGNSATALALAYAAASGGDRALLIDTTSTNPELSQIFASSFKPSDIGPLDNKEHLSDIITKDARSGLDFLPIALADLRTLKTAQRRRMIAGLNGLSLGYDLVFIDAGNVLEDEAASCLLPAADQVLIVARAGTTTPKEIGETLEVLEPARERISGAILTMTA